MDDPMKLAAGSSDDQEFFERAVTPDKDRILHGGNRAPDGYAAPHAAPAFLAQRLSTPRHGALAAMLATGEHLSVAANGGRAPKAAMQPNAAALNPRGVVS